MYFPIETRRSHNRIASNKAVHTLLKNGVIAHWSTIILMPFAYLTYFGPTAGLLCIFYFTSSQSYVCQDLKAPFLLDNSIGPAKNLSLAMLYEQRQKLGREKWPNTSNSGELWEDYKPNGMMIWDAGFDLGRNHENRGKYWKLTNIDDLITQLEVSKCQT